jgi:hypothetical protein
MPAQHTREQLAWAAGLFDGEGTIVALVRRSRNSHARDLIIGVSQAGEHAERLLERFRAAVGGLGRVYRVHGATRPAAWKVGYMWRSGRFEAVQQVVCLLWPWLGPAKRAQASMALRNYRDYPRMRMTTERGRLMAERRWRCA